MVVANPEHGYAGTLDYTIGDGLIGDALRAPGTTSPAGVDLMGDTKTGGEWDRLTSAGHVHGVYPEAGLQMSAYRRAKVCWLRDGEGADAADGEVGVVLHLRPEGYRLYPVRCGDLEYAYFRHAQMVDEWSSRLASAKADDPVIGRRCSCPRSSRRWRDGHQHLRVCSHDRHLSDQLTGDGRPPELDLHGRPHSDRWHPHTPQRRDPSSTTSTPPIR
jgi:hypothetical protein